MNLLSTFYHIYFIESSFLKLTYFILVHYRNYSNLSSRIKNQFLIRNKYLKQIIKLHG